MPGWARVLSILCWIKQFRSCPCESESPSNGAKQMNKKSNTCSIANGRMLWGGRTGYDRVTLGGRCWGNKWLWKASLHKWHSGWGLRVKMLVIRRVFHTVANVCRGSMVGTNLIKEWKGGPWAKASPFILGATGSSWGIFKWGSKQIWLMSKNDYSGSFRERELEETKVGAGEPVEGY